MCQYMVLLKVLYFFFLKPFHINKDTRFQNIDAYEDFFWYGKAIV